MLDHNLQISVDSVTRQWRVRQIQQLRMFEAVARQPYLRAYLAAGEKTQMDYFAEQVKKQGASVIAILNIEGVAMATHGADSEQLIVLGKSGSLSTTGEIAQLGSGLFFCYQIPIGQNPRTGYLLIAQEITQDQLREDTAPYSIAVTLLENQVMLSTLPSKLLPTVDDVRRGKSIQNPGFQTEFRHQGISMGRAYALFSISRHQPHDQMQHLVRQLLLLIALLSLLGLGAVALFVGRVLAPLEKLEGATKALGRSQFRDVQEALTRLSQRKDELGTLARALRLSAKRQQIVLATCQQLASSLGATRDALEQATRAGAGAGGPTDYNLDGLRKIVEPLADAMDQSALTLQDSFNVASNMVSDANLANQQFSELVVNLRRFDEVFNDAVSLDRSALLDQFGTRVSSFKIGLNEQKTLLGRLRFHAQEIKKLLERVTSNQLIEQSNGKLTQRIGQEVLRVSKTYQRDLKILAQSSRNLHADMELVANLLHSMEQANPQVELQRSSPTLPSVSPGPDASRSGQPSDTSPPQARSDPNHTAGGERVPLSQSTTLARSPTGKISTSVNSSTSSSIRSGNSNQ